MELSDQTIDVVKSTVPIFKERGGDIVLKFYDTLFKRYPSVKSHFNIDRQKGGVSTEDGLPLQVSALAKAVLAYAANINNVKVLIPTIERISHKHISRDVQPEQYDAVGECLLYAMQEILGSKVATEEVMTAWKEAFGYLAHTFIEMETRLRTELTKKAGYSGLIDMRVVSIDKDSNTVFTNKPSDAAILLGLKPVDHDTPQFENGQFVAIDIALDNGQHTMTSMKLVHHSSSEDILTLRVPNNEERSTAVLRNASVGDVFKVSMPCGKC